jgi:4-hydroxy-tetrahydrodipicolinate synthase
MARTPPFARVIAATATPFHDDLSVDYAHLVSHANWLLANGCDGLVMFGSTGESASLTLAERYTIVKALAAAGIAPSALLIGTGCCAIEDTVSLTSMALAAGCAGALVQPPFFFKGVSDEGVENFYRQLIDKVADARLRLYLYHYPQTVGVGVSPGLTARLLKRYPQTIAGYKDSSGDFANTMTIAKEFPTLDVFVATEARYLEFRESGGAGCVSATANVQSAAIRRLETALGTPAAAGLQAQVAAVRKVLEGAKGISSVKAMLAQIHASADWMRTRPPLLGLTSEEARALSETVASLSTR